MRYEVWWGDHWRDEGYGLEPETGACKLDTCGSYALAESVAEIQAMICLGEYEGGELVIVDDCGNIVGGPWSCEKSADGILTE